jgi:hypothetical protein
MADISLSDPAQSTAIRPPAHYYQHEIRTDKVPIFAKKISKTETNSRVDAVARKSQANQPAFSVRWFNSRYLATT